MEVRVYTFRVSAHESEEFGDHISGLPLDRHLLRENKLEIRLHLVTRLVKTKQHFWGYGALVPNRALNALFESGLGKTSHHEILDDVVTVRLHTRSTLHINNN